VDPTGLDAGQDDAQGRWVRSLAGIELTIPGRGSDSPVQRKSLIALLAIRSCRGTASSQPSQDGANENCVRLAFSSHQTTRGLNLPSGWQRHQSYSGNNRPFFAPPDAARSMQTGSRRFRPRRRPEWSRWTVPRWPHDAAVSRHGPDGRLDQRDLLGPANVG
jgi:hypothetical protein